MKPEIDLSETVRIDANNVQAALNHLGATAGLYNDVRAEYELLLGLFSMPDAKGGVAPTSNFR